MTSDIHTCSSPVTTDEISRLIAENIEVEAWETDGGSVASVSGIKEASEAILAAFVRSGPAQRRGPEIGHIAVFVPSEGVSAADLPEFEDPRVQIVYELLCDIQQPPNPEEHWEGWNARRIVAALAPGNGAVEADREKIAKIFAVIWHGDIGEWEGFLSKADAFLAYPGSLSSTVRTDLWACTGCGSQKTMDQIKGEHPQALSCCPERKMAPVPQPTEPSK